MPGLLDAFPVPVVRMASRDSDDAAVLVDDGPWLSTRGYGLGGC